MTKLWKNIIAGSVALSCMTATALTVYCDNGQYIIGDLNGDGNVNTEDALLILNKSIGSIEKFPIEELTGDTTQTVIITDDDQSRTITDSNGRTLLEASVIYPSVEVQGNPTVSSAINQVLEQVKYTENDFQSYADLTAETYYEEGYTSSSSYLNASYTVTYNNGRILSIVISTRSYSAGAIHDYYGYTAFNFDLSTGALITTPMLMENAYEFQSSASEYIYNQISDYCIASDKYDVLSEIGENWYINENGKFVYFFNPYEVASFASGIVEVEIPDADSYYKYYYYNLFGRG